MLQLTHSTDPKLDNPRRHDLFAEKLLCGVRLDVYSGNLRSRATIVALHGQINYAESSI